MPCNLETLSTAVSHYGRIRRTPTELNPLSLMGRLLNRKAQAEKLRHQNMMGGRQHTFNYKSLIFSD